MKRTRLLKVFMALLTYRLCGLIVGRRSPGGRCGAGNAVLMRLVEIGANRQSCDPCATLVLKSVFEVVLGSTQASFPG